MTGGLWEWDAGDAGGCGRGSAEAHLRGEPPGTLVVLREVRLVLGGDLEGCYEPTGRVAEAVREADGSVRWPAA